MLSFLKEEGVSSELLEKLAQFRTDNPTELPERVPVPQFHYYGREVWEQAIAALLCGKNLLPRCYSMVKSKAIEYKREVGNGFSSNYGEFLF